MSGDGVNDALALAKAQIGIAVGSGTDVAAESGYNIFAIPLAAGVLYRAGVLLSPAAGALLMSLSTVIVAINARLLQVAKSDGDKT